MAEAKHNSPKPAPAAASPAPEASPDPLIGAHLGEYVVEKAIGSGGMGLVYRGMQPLIGKPVAIKVLQWETARNPEEVQRLLAEAQLVNAIRHRGIVDIFAFGTTPDGRNYLVMELLEGDALDAVIARRAPLPITEVMDVLDEILDALGAAHAAGVIHRDLKPQNVFIVSPAHGQRYIKLLDFGLAKKSLTPGGKAAQTRASMIVGTPYYMSPEQARGEEISPQTDLYALGVLAYEMLTSRLPFEAPTPYEVITQHLNTPAPRVRALERSIPEELDELIATMLQKAQGDRPRSAQDLRQELNRLRKRLQSDATQIGEPISRPPPPRALIEEPAPAPPPRVSSLRSTPPVDLLPPPVADDEEPLELADGPATMPFEAVGDPDAPSTPVGNMDAGPLELGGPPVPRDSEPEPRPVSRPPFRASASMRRSRADLPRDLKVPVARRKRNYKPLWGALVALLLLTLGAYAALLFRPDLAAAVPVDLSPLQLDKVRSMLPAMPQMPKIQIVPGGEDPEPAAPPKDPKADPAAKDAPSGKADPKAEPAKAPAAAKTK
ncbi:MAG TPA: protein kinase [Myxococcales bacterium]|jgi:serine/threonine-protein kinase